MREWMTPERVMEILKRSDQAGIAAGSCIPTPNCPAAFRRYKAEGGKMHAFP